MIAVWVSAAAAFSHLGRGNAWYAALAPGATLALLLVFRRRFSVKSDISSVAQGVELMLFSLAVALLYGALGFWLMDKRDFCIDFHLGDAFPLTLRQLLLIGNPDLTGHTRHARWFLESLRILGIVTGVFAAYSLFRPVAYRLRTLPHERALAAEILARHSRSPNDFFKLWGDKSYFFSSSRQAVIAYRASMSVAISLGDPVGPEEELEPLTRAFLDYCEQNGWSVAFHQVLPDLLPLYRRLVLAILKIGEEAVVDLEQFSTRTSRNKEFRRVLRKFRTDGFTLARSTPPHPGALLEEVRSISDEWLTLPGRRERAFTLGRFERGYIARSPLDVLRDSKGRAVAFVNEIPSYRKGEATIDLMRHRLDMPNGAMDFLFAELLLALHERGFGKFNLGLAPFAGVGDRPGSSLRERAIFQVFERLNRFFSYKGMRHYKGKFEPEWEPRFLAYQGGPIGLLRATVALTRVTEG